MPRSLPAQVITQMDATGKKPVLLFELGLSSTLRFAATISNITFPTGGNTYTAKAIEVTSMVQALEGQIGRITVKFDNVVRDMAAYAYNERFRGKSLVIKRIYRDALGNATYYNEVFRGTMETPSGVTRHWLTVSATSGKPISRKALKLPYQRMCPLVFGGPECNTDGLADLTSLTASGTADSGTASTLVDSALTQADDYWNFGNIKITKSGVEYRRKIKDFVAASDALTFDVELPVTIDDSCTYILYKGCDQTWDTCSGDNAWGPSADNSLNFMGCVHIVRPIYGDIKDPVVVDTAQLIEDRFGSYDDPGGADSEGEASGGSGIGGNAMGGDFV